MGQKELVSQLGIEVDILRGEDIERLVPILREHVRDRNKGEIVEGEIEEIQGYMRSQPDEYGRVRKYIVARGETGGVYGCMAYSNPDPDMVRHFGSDGHQAAELLNAFVSSQLFRGGGVGRKLFEELCNRAWIDGKTELWINSGPRYKKSWGFYDRVCDENRGFIVEKYGKGGDANTWLKKLT